ncbi:hypothetical protein DENIT_70034 [Pseudomonas veronii]|nr:hypothetical protein DENIT_70034 [Pseudomonas veronii]
MKTKAVNKPYQPWLQIRCRYETGGKSELHLGSNWVWHALGAWETGTVTVYGETAELLAGIADETDSVEGLELASHSMPSFVLERNTPPSATGLHR